MHGPNLVHSFAPWPPRASFREQSLTSSIRPLQVRKSPPDRVRFASTPRQCSGQQVIFMASESGFHFAPTSIPPHGTTTVSPYVPIHRRFSRVLRSQCSSRWRVRAWMKDLGATACRVSICWPRVFPEGTTIMLVGLAVVSRESVSWVSRPARRMPPWTSRFENGLARSLARTSCWNSSAKAAWA
jgi:hypothetical protein